MARKDHITYGRFLLTQPSACARETAAMPKGSSCTKSNATHIKNLLVPLFLMGCFPLDFQDVKRPLRTKSVKRPIQVGKRPINEGKRPIKAKVLVGVSVGSLMGCFTAPPTWRKTAPLKRPIKRSMSIAIHWAQVEFLLSQRRRPLARPPFSFVPQACFSLCKTGAISIGNLYLINSKKLQIGIGIGKFSIINSEELHIGNFLGTEP